LPVKEDIMVVTPVDGIGEYGGIWHETTWWQGMGNIEMTVYDPPVRWKADYTGYEPGLVKEWEISEDGKTLTWHFRQGVKWSDGVDFIPAVDLAYWWELATNEDFKLVNIPFWGRDSDGTPMEVSFPMTILWSCSGRRIHRVSSPGLLGMAAHGAPSFSSDPTSDSSKTYET
jgi:ABC-type transport system substrate-binding protein